jgi:hypothetical protein
MRVVAIALGLIGATAFAVTHAFAQQSPPPTDDSFPGVAQPIGVGRQIETIQSLHGITSPELIGPLTNLGLILREQDDHDLAAAAFERARHVVRVNYGLSSFEEAPLLRQLVQIEEAKGNAAAAWNLEQKLLGLIERHPGPRAAPMLKEIADKRADVLRRYSSGEMPPQIMLGCYYAQPRRGGGGGGCPHSGSSHTVKISLLDEARSYYIHTIAMVQQSGGLSSDELPELYLAWVRALYTFPDSRVTGYEGRLLLRDLHTLAVRHGEPLAVRMSSLVDIADWDLLFARGRKETEAAFQAYEALYERVEQEGLEPSLIDELFSPSVPVVLPALMPSPLAAVQTPASAGYIDVAFEITKYGQGQSIEILDTSTNKTEAARVRLRDLIKWSRFRPRVANGAFEDRSRVVVRYYVND